MKHHSIINILALWVLFVVCPQIVMAQNKRNITLAEAGTLPNYISDAEKYLIEELTISGPLNGTDLRLIRDMAGCNYLGENTVGKLTVLDISETRIVPGGEKYVDTEQLPYWGGNFRYAVDMYDVLPIHVFHGCKFKEIQMPKTINSIQAGAFARCQELVSILVPYTVTSIEYDAFSGCEKLNSVTISNGVKKLRPYAFASCQALTSIEIPSSVTSIAGSVFAGCSNLTTIYVQEGNPIYSSPDNCNAIVETASGTLVAGCKNSVIPSCVKRIGEAAFSDCSNIHSITLPNSVTHIGNYAFRNCSSLKSIQIPAQVSAIGESIFAYCQSLSSISVDAANPIYSSPDDCNAIVENGSQTLIAGCQTTKIPSGVKQIGKYAFSGCNGLNSMDIPEGVTTIGQGAFNGCSGLKKLQLPNSLTVIGSDVFSGCNSLSSIQIPSSVSSINGWAFNGCNSLREIILESVDPNKIALGQNALGNIPLGCVLRVPDGTLDAYKNSDWSVYFSLIKEISQATNTKSVILGQAGTLADYISEDEKYEIEELAITGSLNGTDLRLIREMAGNNYRGEMTAGQLKKLDLTNARIVAGGEMYLDTDNGIQVNNGGIGGNLHYNTQDDIIGKYLFAGLERLEDVKIPLDTKQIDDKAFMCCTGLSAFVFPDGVISIGNATFYQCLNIEHISLPYSLTTIGSQAFQGLTSLASVVIPKSVTSIGHSAFYGCSILSSIRVEDGNTMFSSPDNCNAIIEGGSRLIAGCKSTIIPSNIRYISDCAFQGCSGLSSVTIPRYVNYIGFAAFEGCINLTEVISLVKQPNSVLSNHVFDRIPSAAVLKIPYGTLDAYKAAGWDSYFGSIEEMPYKPSVKKTITVETAGTLANYISGNEKYEIEELTVSGPLNGTDFRLLRDMAGNDYQGNLTDGQLSKLDLSGATIVAGGEKYLDTESVNYINGSAGGNFRRHIESDNEISAELFAGCNELSEIKLPIGVRKIGSSAFYMCLNLCSVHIPEQSSSGLEAIESCAFADCSSLTAVDMPTSVKKIGSMAFSNTGLETIELPNGVVTIGDNAFQRCNGLCSVKIPSSVIKIGNGCFAACPNLSSLVVDSHNVKYDSRNNCNAIIETSSKRLIVGCNSTIIPESVKSLGPYAFSSCSNLTKLDIPKGITAISEGAYAHCSGFTSIIIPQNIVAIGSWAFNHCNNLSNLTIPNSVTDIEQYAFAYCWNLSTVKSFIENPITVATAENIFLELSSNAILYVPYGSKALYEAIPEWNVFKEIVEMEPTTTDVSQMTEAVYMKPSTATIGRDAKLEVRLKSSVPSAGYQFDVVLPADVTPVSAQMTSNNHSTFTLSTSTPEENVYRVVVYSPSAKTMAAGDVAAINLTVHVADNVATGDYSLVIRNASISTDDNQSIRPAETMTLLTIDDVKTGDVNHDNYIDVADVVDLVNYILGKASADFVVRAADVNSDGYIDVADVVGIVNIILGKTSGARSMVKHEDSVQGTVGDAVSLWNGEHGELSLLLDNVADYIAAQLDVRLSEGQTLEQVTKGQRARGHQLATAKMGEGVYRVLLYTIGDRTFSGQSGEVVSLGVAGEGDVSVENITFITAGDSRKKFDNLSNQLTGIGATLNDNGEMINDKGVWHDLQGRRLETAPTSKGIYLKNGKKVVVK